MSRIHEALKKAQLERAAIETVEVSPEPAAPVTNLAPKEQKAVPLISPEDRVEASPRTGISHEFLEFDDLIAHCSHPQWHPDQKTSVFNADLGPHGAEQFRTLRSRLYQMRSDQRLRILLVTSSVKQEGKTFVTSNLARAIVQQPDRRVLAIDADLRCSRLHVPFGAPSSPGLTDYLRGDADETTVIQCAKEGNLCFIPGGTDVSNPSELLSNGRLKILLDRVAPAFDWVIVDSPPCVPVADASVLADFCDAVLLVVKAGSTPSAMIQKAHQEMKDKNIAGVVLNTADAATLDYGSYYGYGYYGQSRDIKPGKQ